LRNLSRVKSLINSENYNVFIEEFLIVPFDDFRKK